jgi:acyl-CoA thioesterase
MSGLEGALSLSGEGPVFRARIGAEWSQGRAAFGGLLAAFAVRAARRVVGEDRPLRSVLMDFVAPAEVGEVEVEVSLLRAGRGISHAQVQLRQKGQPLVVLLLAYGSGRSTALAWPASQRPELPDPESLAPLPYVEGIIPAFTQNFDFRWTRGDYPFTGGTRPEIGGWVRPRVPTPPDEALVLALADSWPAPILPLLSGHAPASTVTWMVDFVGPIHGAPGDWWAFYGDAVQAGDGYSSIEGRLWGPSGALVAVSRQCVAEFSRS